jgi:hypothetical protein
VQACGETAQTKSPAGPVRPSGADLKIDRKA